MTNLNILTNLEKLLNKRKQETGWITVEKMLNYLNYRLDNLNKIENEIIEALKKKFGIIENIKIIEVRSLIDKMMLDINSNYLFELDAILEIKEQVTNIIIHNI